LLGRKAGARRSDAGHLRYRLSQLHVRQAPDPEAARRLSKPGRRQILAQEIPRRGSKPRPAPDSPPSRNDVEGQSEMGRSAVIGGQASSLTRPTGFQPVEKDSDAGSTSAESARMANFRRHPATAIRERAAA